MTKYWELNDADIKARGLDMDLGGCLDYNPQPFGLDDIAQVLAVWEGENDGDSWRWIIKMRDDRFALLVGGCDYTGWDCQSWANTYWVDTPQAAAVMASDKPDWDEKREDVYSALMAQLATGKKTTWHEANDALFNHPKQVNLSK